MSDCVPPSSHAAKASQANGRSDQESQHRKFECPGDPGREEGSGRGADCRARKAGQGFLVLSSRDAVLTIFVFIFILMSNALHSYFIPTVLHRPPGPGLYPGCLAREQRRDLKSGSTGRGPSTNKHLLTTYLLPQLTAADLLYLPTYLPTYLPAAAQRIPSHPIPSLSIIRFISTLKPPRATRPHINPPISVYITTTPLALCSVKELEIRSQQFGFG